MSVTGLLLGAAQAQEPAPDFVETKAVQEEVTARKKAKAKGWALSFKLGSNASLNDSRSVVGSVGDGTTFQLGLVLDGAANLHSGVHEWRNHLHVAHTQTRTPVIDSFVKTLDDLELKSTYLFSLSDTGLWGLFARARMQTNVIKSELVFAEPTELTLTDGDVVESRTLQAEEVYQIAGAFEPILLRESAGVFLRPADEETFKLLVTLGFGAQEVLARDGYALADNEDTPQKELVRLEDTQQAGLEGEIEGSGRLNKALSWGLLANALHPLVTSGENPQELEGLELTNLEFSGKLAVQLSSWASLDYVISAKRVPLVLDEWQLQNGLFLRASFEVQRAPEAPKPPASAPTSAPAKQ